MTTPRAVPLRGLNGVGLVHVSPRTTKLAADPRSLTLRAIISTADVDRAGDVVVSAGLRNVSEYLSNPVVLWAHQRNLPPIGTCTALEVQADRVVAETRFAHGVGFAEELFRLYDQGVLRGWSIGFLPLKARRMPADDSGRRGLRIEEWDLLEYSAVPVPENPGALTLAIQKGIVRDPLLRRCLLDVPDERGGRFWSTTDPFSDLLAAPACEQTIPAGAD